MPEDFKLEQIVERILKRRERKDREQFGMEMFLLPQLKSLWEKLKHNISGIVITKESYILEAGGMDSEEILATTIPKFKQAYEDDFQTYFTDKDLPKVLDFAEAEARMIWYLERSLKLLKGEVQ